MSSGANLEKWILAVAAIFVLTLFGLVTLAVRFIGVGLPTCVTDVQPFTTGEIIQQTPKHYEIHYVARMWSFAPAEITIPVGSTADIYLSSADVTHGMYIGGTNVNLMAVPGTVNFARVKFDKPGDYDILCHEYCGVGHHNMATKIHIVNRNVDILPVAPVQLPAGAFVLQARGCVACHSTDGTPSVGPTLKGVFGRTEALEGGGTVKVDESYILESIRNPQAKVVKGFPPAMPKLQLTEEELKHVSDYLQTIK